VIVAVLSFFQATSDPADGSSATTDLSGNGNSGTVYGGSWVDASYGVSSGRALRFAGGKTGIEWASKIAPSSGPFTVRLWVKCDSDSSVVDKFLYARANAAKTTVDDYVFYFNDGNELRFLPVGGGGSYLRYSVDLRDDTWHQIVYSTDGTNQYLFLDDSQVATNALFSTLSDDATCDVFGAPVNDQTGGRGWDGDVSLIAVSDTATDLATVQADYALGPFHNPFATDLSTGLQGWWCPSRDTAGNGTTTLTDLSGNGNDGTLTNMDAATDWVADTANGGVRALDFDGSSQRVVMSDAGLPLTGDLTLSFWFLYRSTASIQGVLSQYTAGTPGRTVAAINQSIGGGLDPNRLNLFSSFPGGLDANLLLSGTDTYHHIVLRRSGSQGTVYVNGVLAVTDSDWPTAIQDTPFVLGAFDSSGLLSLDGRIDNTAIWDRAITAAEVTQLYNGGRSLQLVDLSTGLQGWWCPSRDTSGNGTTTLTDLSGNGKNASLVDDAGANAWDTATHWVADTDNSGVRALSFDSGRWGDPSWSFAPFGPITFSYWYKATPESKTRGTGLDRASASNRGFIGADFGGQFLWDYPTAYPASGRVSYTPPNINDYRDTWVHVLCRSGGDGGNIQDIWLNGVQVASRGSSTGSSTPSAFLIGTALGSRAYSIYGLMDSMAVWDRLLTADEVTQLYNGGRSFNLLSTGATIVPQLLLRRRRLSGGLVI